MCMVHTANTCEDAIVTCLLMFETPSGLVAAFPFTQATDFFFMFIQSRRFEPPGI